MEATKLYFTEDEKVAFLMKLGYTIEDKKIYNYGMANQLVVEKVAIKNGEKLLMDTAFEFELRQKLLNL